MHRRLWQLWWVPILIFLFHASPRRPEQVFAAGNSASATPRFSGAFGRLPIAFEPNRGQADSQIQFMVQQWNAAPVAVALGRRGELRAAFADGATSVQMEIAGGNPAPETQTIGRLPGRYNHFESRDSRRWIHGVPSYDRVEYRNVYPDIDLTYSGRDGRLEYDWVVAAGADPDAIRLTFPNDPGAEINSAGELVAGSRGQLRHRPPRAYQLKNGKREYLSARFIRRGPHTFGFAVGPYDRTRELVIDPTLVYSLTMGSTTLLTCCVAPTFQVDQGTAMAVDPVGNVYIGGNLGSAFSAFPPIRRVPANAKNFVLKLDPTGTQVLYGTFFSIADFAAGGIAGLAVDASGNAYLTGTADSTFTVTPGAAQAAFGGGADAFAAKLDGSGNLVYSTYIGGSRGDKGTAVAVDAAGNAYITGETASDDFPTVHAVQAQRKGAMCINPSGSLTYCPDAFVTMVNPDGTGFVYSTYLGGTEYDHASGIAVDPAGNAYIAGHTNSADFPVTAGVVQNQFGGGTTCVEPGDGFVAKLGLGGQSLVYATYVGGHGCDSVAGIAVDSSGAAYVAGSTQSLDFPVTPGAFQSTFGGWGRCLQNTGDAFVAKLNPQATAFAYATYLGGHSCDNASAIAVDAAGNAYVTGRTASADFPVYRPIQPMFGGPVDCTEFGLPVTIECSNAFVTVLDSGGKAPLQSTFLGSPALEQGTAIEVDGAGNTYVMGLVFRSTLSVNLANFPQVGSQLQQPSGPIFVVKIGPGGVAPSFTQNSITDSSGSLSGLIAGATAVISGSNLTTASGTVTAPSPPPTTLMGTSVSINGTPVPILSLNGASNPQQISIQVPAPLAAGLATVVVNNNGNVSDVTGVPADVQIQRTGDAQAGIAGHPLTVPLSVGIPGITSNVSWEAEDGGFITVPSGSSGAVWTLGQALGSHTAVARIRPPSGGPYTVQFTATASAGNVPAPAVTSVLNTAGFPKAPAVLSAGMIASVFGTNLSEAPSSGVAASFIQISYQYQLPTILAGAQVTFDGLAAPLFMVSPGQINLQVPYELAGYPSAQVVVTVAGIASPPMTVTLAPASPGIFTVNAQDQNLAAVLNQDNSVNSASNPAPAGNVIQMFCTGLGVPLLAGLATGEPASSDFLHRTVDTPAVTIGGSPALVEFSGLAPGFVGLYQVNIEVPVGISPGEVPLALGMSGKSANPVTVFVR